MAAKAGREETLTWDGNRLCGREKNLALNGENIEASDECSSGWQELLNVSAQDSVEITVTGLDKDDTLLQAWFDQERTEAMSWTRKSGAVISGDFRLSALSFGAPYNGEATFEATFSSTGAVTLTPAA